MTEGIRLRDPAEDPLHITRSALEGLARMLRHVDQPGPDDIMAARVEILGILARVTLVYLPRLTVRLDGIRLIIRGDDIVWAGSRHGGVPFYPDMTSATGASQQ